MTFVCRLSLSLSLWLGIPLTGYGSLDGSSHSRDSLTICNEYCYSRCLLSNMLSNARAPTAADRADAADDDDQSINQSMNRSIVRATQVRNAIGTPARASGHGSAAHPAGDQPAPRWMDATCERASSRARWGGARSIVQTCTNKSSGRALLY